MAQKERHYYEPEQRHSPVIQNLAKNITKWSMFKTGMKMRLEIIKNLFKPKKHEN